MKRAIPFIVSMSLSSASIAQAWVPFATCGDGEQLRSYSYDPSSIVTEGANRVVIIRGDYSRVRGSRASEGRLSWRLDCGSRTYTEDSRTELRADGTVAIKYDAPTGRMVIIPASVADKLAREICVAPAKRP